MSNMIILVRPIMNMLRVRVDYEMHLRNIRKPLSTLNVHYGGLIFFYIMCDRYSYVKLVADFEKKKMFDHNKGL